MPQARKDRYPFTLWQLQVFCDVATLGGYSAAARHLEITQPAASGLITQLERVVGLSLMERDGRGVRLTAEGRLLYEQAQRTIASAASLQSLIGQIGQGERGHLSIGTGATIAASHLAQIVAEFRRSYAGIEVALAVENRNRLTEGLLNGRHQLIITAGTLEAAQGTLFMPDELLLVASPRHELAGRSSLPLSALARAPVFMRERGSQARHLFEQLTLAQGAQFETVIEIADNEAIKRVVAHELGTAVLTRGTVQRELAEGTLIELNVLGMPLPFDFYAYWLDRGHGLLDLFRDYLLSRRPGRRVVGDPSLPALPKRESDHGSPSSDLCH